MLNSSPVRGVVEVKLTTALFKREKARDYPQGEFLVGTIVLKLLSQSDEILRKWVEEGYMLCIPEIF